MASDPLIDILVLLPSTMERVDLGCGLPAEPYARVLHHLFSGLILPRLKLMDVCQSVCVLGQASRHVSVVCGWGKKRQSPRRVTQKSNPFTYIHLTPQHPNTPQHFQHDGVLPGLALDALVEAAEMTATTGNVGETCMATLEYLLLGDDLAMAETAVRAVNALK